MFHGMDTVQNLSGGDGLSCPAVLPAHRPLQTQGEQQGPATTKLCPPEMRLLLEGYGHLHWRR